MELVALEHTLYTPEYDPDRGKYKDKSPFPKNSRNNPTYECRCKVGTLFKSYSQFSTHCRTMTHQKFINDYSRYYKESDKAQEEIRNLTISNERLKRKLQKCEGIIRIRDLEISFLNGIGKAEEEEIYEDALEEPGVLP